MFESHLAGPANGTALADDGTSWMEDLISTTGGAVKDLTNRGIDELTGTSAIPASAPQAASVPSSTINQLPGQVPPGQLPVVDPNALMMAPPPPQRPNKLLVYGGLAAVGVVGYLWWTGKIGNRKVSNRKVSNRRKSRRRRR